MPLLSRNRSMTLLTTFLIGASAVLAFPAAAAPAPDPDPFFGVTPQTPMSGEEYDTMVEGNMGSMRIPLEWRVVEPEEDEDFVWDTVDAIVRETAPRGIRVLPFIYAVPDWIGPDWRRMPLDGHYEAKRWRQMLRAAADRYGPQGDFWMENPDLRPLPIRTWQIWNEPNIKFFAKPTSAARFARLLKASRAALRSVDRGARVMMAGIYGDPPNGKGVRSDRFLSQLYRQKGFRKSYDVAALHPYSKGTKPMKQLVNGFREVLDDHGQDFKRLALTEIGWNSDSETGFGRGTPEAQAQQLTSAYRWLSNAKNRLELTGLYWFTWKDIPYSVPSCAFCHRSGLFSIQDEFKPAWSSLMAFTGGF